MNTTKFIDEHLYPGQIGYFLTILSLIASLVATYSFAKAFFSKENKGTRPNITTI